MTFYAITENLIILLKVPKNLAENSAHYFSSHFFWHFFIKVIDTSQDLNWISGIINHLFA